jgi:hypothetical protein
MSVPAWESLVSDIPAGDGKKDNLFLQRKWQQTVSLKGLQRENRKLDGYLRVFKECAQSEISPISIA